MRFFTLMKNHYHKEKRFYKFYAKIRPSIQGLFLILTKIKDIISDFELKSKVPN